MVVQDWEQAERGLDFMRADLDGRATFLVHPEPGDRRRRRLPRAGHRPGDRHRRAPERCAAPDQRLRRPRRQDLLPRLARCFLAEDRAAAQRLARQYPHLYFLLPDGVCYHGHAVSGGKKTRQRSAGAEARAARADGRS